MTESNDATRARIRERLEALRVAGASPGIQYAAARRDGEILAAAVGSADLGSRTQLTDTTPLMAYSMSKTVTAAAVLKLAAEGRLDLDARADAFLALPYGPEVTVRRLLCHTAGLPTPIPLRWVHLPSEQAAFDERAALSAVIARHPRLAAAPGTRFRYSNLGYWLLGPIVEACAGEPFVDYVRRELFFPLGLGAQRLGYEAAPGTAVATGYLEKWSWLNLAKGLVLDAKFFGRYRGPWLEIRPHYVDGAAFGGLVGSATAFAAWLRDLLGEKSRTLPPAAVRLLFEQQRTSAGELVPMTLGWHIDGAAGARHFFKEGGGGGFHCMMRLYPERGLASVVMGNATAFRAGRALDELDRLLLERA